jgi:hypothetical protein
MTYRLLICFPFTPSFSMISDIVEKLVGKERSGSGAGLGFRDMDWNFDTKDEADAAAARVRRTYPHFDIEVRQDTDNGEPVTED